MLIFDLETNAMKIEHAAKVNSWLIDNLPYECIWVNKVGTIEFSNNKFCKTIGYKKSELIGLSIFDINPFVTTASWEAHWNKLEEQKEDRFFETHRNSKGEYYEVEVNAFFFSNNGNSYVCSILNDVTQSRFYQFLLQQTESIGQIGGWSLSLEDDQLLVSEEAMKLFDQEKEFFYPRTVANYFLERDEFQKVYLETLRKGVGYDRVFQSRDEPKRYFRCIGEPILKKGRVRRITGVYQDITEQQERENSLKLFDEVIDNAEDLIYVYNREGKLLHYNESVVRHLGFTTNQLDAFSIF